MASGTREDMTKQAEWSEATVRTATFLAVGLALLAVGSWLQLRPALKSRELTTETAVVETRKVSPLLCSVCGDIAALTVT